VTFCIGLYIVMYTLINSLNYYRAIPSVTDEQTDTFYDTVLCYSSTQFYKTLRISCNTYALRMPHL